MQENKKVLDLIAYVRENKKGVKYLVTYYKDDKSHVETFLTMYAPKQEGHEKAQRITLDERFRKDDVLKVTYHGYDVKELENDKCSKVVFNANVEWVK